MLLSGVLARDQSKVQTGVCCQLAAIVNDSAERLRQVRMLPPPASSMPRLAIVPVVEGSSAVEYRVKESPVDLAEMCYPLSARTARRHPACPFMIGMKKAWKPSGFGRKFLRFHVLETVLLGGASHLVHCSLSRLLAKH